MDIKREKFDELGVHDLRRMARSLGAKSPTTQKKEELIDFICQQLENGEEFNHTQTRGRKCKKPVFNANKVTEVPDVLRRDFLLPQNKEFEHYFSFAKEFVGDVNSLNFETKKGVLCEYKSYFCLLLSTGEFVYLPNEIVQENFLEIGDIIEAKCEKTDMENIFIAHDILLVNGENVLDIQRNLCDFDDISLEEVSDEISNIKIGSKFACKVDDFISFHQNYVNGFYEKKFKVVSLAVGVSMLEKIKFERVALGENFISLKDKMIDFAYFAIKSAIDRASLLARAGEKVVLFIPNLENLYSELDLFFEQSGEERFNHTKSATNLVRKILGLNRNLTNGGSITTIITSKQNITL